MIHDISGTRARERLRVLHERRDAFLGFLAARLGGDHAAAEDLLQQGFVKAIAAAPTLRDEDRLVPWFYQLLRNALIDRARSSRAAADRERRWSEDSLTSSDVERQLCACLGPLVDSLPPAQATLIRRCELADDLVARVAPEIGLSANAASVALHRARAALREKLRVFCGDCSTTACLDCDCGM